MDCAALTIPQGTTRLITASNIVDGTGAPLDVTGWAVRAVIRTPGVGGPIVAYWSTTPITGQGTATAAGSEITLRVTPAMSIPWAWSRGVLHAEITEPGVNGRTERIIDKPVYLSPEAVTM